MVAEVTPGSPARVLAEEREITRLGASVFRNGEVSRDAMGLLCAVLVRMAHVYQRHEVAGVRAVATSAIRDTSNQGEFVENASAAIGAAVGGRLRSRRSAFDSSGSANRVGRTRRVEFC